MSTQVAWSQPHPSFIANLSNNKHCARKFATYFCHFYFGLVMRASAAAHMVDFVTIQMSDVKQSIWL